MLIRLAGTKDPRVAVAAGYALNDSNKYLEDRISVCGGPGWFTSEEPLNLMAASILHTYYLPPGSKRDLQVVRDWWEANGADLRRRAKLLPE